MLPRRLRHLYVDTFSPGFQLNDIYGFLRDGRRFYSRDIFDELDVCNVDKFIQIHVKTLLMISYNKYATSMHFIPQTFREKGVHLTLIETFIAILVLVLICLWLLSVLEFPIKRRYGFLHQ